MVDPYDEIDFLIRSENRITVLTTLADGPRTAGDLTDELDITSITVDRTLDKLTDRGWVRETDAGYETTALGQLLAADYERLASSMGVAASLGPDVELLPVEQMDFDLRHLTTARMTDPNDRKALRIVDRWIELIGCSTRVRTLVYDAGEVAAAAIVDALSAGGLDFEAVLPPSHFAAVRETPSLRDAYRGIVDAGGDLYLADEGPSKPYSVALFDDLAAIAGFDEAGSIRVGIETRADPVYDWAERTYRDHLEAAEALSTADFDP